MRAKNPTKPYEICSRLLAASAAVNVMLIYILDASAKQVTLIDLVKYCKNCTTIFHLSTPVIQSNVLKADEDLV